MRSGAVATRASAPPLVGLQPGSYSTTFGTDEAIVSEGGIWLNGATNGRDWSDNQTSSGSIYGNRFVENSGGEFKDCLSIINPAVIPFTGKQFVQTVVSRAGGYLGTNGHEMELLLCFTLTTGDAHGYECLLNAGGGSQIVRWDGAYSSLGNFTTLTTTGSGFNVPADGDVLRAERLLDGSGTINFYQNGSLKLSATDTTYLTGQPGVAFYIHSGGGNSLTGMGFASFTAGNL